MVSSQENIIIQLATKNHKKSDKYKSGFFYFGYTHIPHSGREGEGKLRKSEVTIGTIYHNEKQGRFYQERRIVDISRTGRYRLYFGQIDKETVSYCIIKKGDKQTEEYRNMTLAKFAVWAKGER